MVRMTRRSLSYWAFGLFGMIYFWIDTIMLSLMAPERVVGWYGATTSLFQTLMFVPMLVQTVWLPRLVGAFVTSRAQLARASRAPVELVVVAAAPIAMTTALLASPVIHLVYGVGFAHAVPVMIALSVCIPPIYLNVILGATLVAANRQRVWAGAMAGAAVVNPILNLVLIPLTEHRYHNGAIGAAISLVATEVVIGVAFALAARDVFDRRLVRRCGSVCLATAGMGVVGDVARPLGTGLSLAAGYATLATLAVLLGLLGRRELELLRSARPLRRARSKT
jgi:O-antigen/teichoic acid export membrane protein